MTATSPSSSAGVARCGLARSTPSSRLFEDRRPRLRDHRERMVCAGDGLIDPRGKPIGSDFVTFWPRPPLRSAGLLRLCSIVLCSSAGPGEGDLCGAPTSGRKNSSASYGWSSAFPRTIHCGRSEGLSTQCWKVCRALSRSSMRATAVSRSRRSGCCGHCCCKPSTRFARNAS